MATNDPAIKIRRLPPVDGPTRLPPVESEQPPARQPRPASAPPVSAAAMGSSDPYYQPGQNAPANEQGQRPSATGSSRRGARKEASGESKESKEEPTVDIRIAREKSSVAFPTRQGTQVELGIRTPPHKTATGYAQIRNGETTAEVSSLPHGGKVVLERAGLPPLVSGSGPLTATVGGSYQRNPENGQQQIRGAIELQQGRVRIAIEAGTKGPSEQEPHKSSESEIGAMLEIKR